MALAGSRGPVPCCRPRRQACSHGGEPGGSAGDWRCVASRASESRMLVDSDSELKTSSRNLRLSWRSNVITSVHCAGRWGPAL